MPCSLFGNIEGKSACRSIFEILSDHQDVFRSITARCCDMLSSKVAPPREGGVLSENMTLDEKVRGWQDKNEEMEMLESDDESSEMGFLGIQEFQDLVRNSCAYTKFLSDILRECVLTTAEPKIIEEIHNVIFQTLPASSNMSREKESERFTMAFKVDWDPLSFVQEQKYSVSPEIAIKTAIVLTGSATEAQALTCGEYLEQTWPCIGADILRLIQAVVKDGPMATSSGKV